MQQPPEAALPPTVSIVMPVYNLEAYVAESIVSIQTQTWGSWELIVVNDGSTDNTEGVVQALASQDVRIRLVSQCNSGAASARNCGLEMIRGDFLVFLDGDDLWRKDFLANAVGKMAETRADCFVCGLERLQPDGSLCPVPTNSRSGNVGTEELIEKCLTGALMLCMGNAVLRVTLALRALRFADDLRYGEDSEYLMRALSMLHSVYIQEAPLFIYRLRPGSATQQPWHWRVRVDSLLSRERTLEYLLEHAKVSRRPALKRLCRRMHLSRLRVLYQMVKTEAWSEVPNILEQEDWRKILRSVAKQGHQKHGYEARIMLSLHLLVWKFVALCARLKTWAAIDKHCSG